MRQIALILLMSVLCGCVEQKTRSENSPPDDLSASGIHWQDWSPAAFEQADREKKLVLLHLGAGWCHWCHVMEHETYRDPQVVALIEAHYIAIHVDQDSRPDLANRYEDYGWPATIIFDASGKELVKWQGYIPPPRMRVLLAATVDDPTPGPSAQKKAEAEPGQSILSAERKSALVHRLNDIYDESQGGWGHGDKLLQADVLEYEMRLASAGDAQAEQRAKFTLAATRKLIDPVWGGIYQYSTDGDWDHQHFEKIMEFQADALRTYSLAYKFWHDDADLNSAKAIYSFLQNFLRSSDGVFYTSEDADVIPGEHSASYFALDDANRRKIGLPRVDQHIYARENGWAARGLVALYAASGDEIYLTQAKNIVDWVAAHRAIDGGGFRHDQRDASGPYLGDNLAMAQAYLAIFQATGQRNYFSAAETTIKFIDEHFKDDSVGYLTSQRSGILPVAPEFDENVNLARTCNLLYQYTGNEQYKQTADRAMRFVIAASNSHIPAPTLLAADELSRDPIHVTIVGPLNDPAAATLHRAALSSPISYLRLDWYDPQQGPPLRDDVDYPTLKQAAAFLCANGACSSPINDPQKLLIQIRKQVSLTAK